SRQPPPLQPRLLLLPKLQLLCLPLPSLLPRVKGPLYNIVAGVAWLRKHAGLLKGKVVEPAFPNMDAKEQQELLERIRSSSDEEEKYPLLFTFDFQEDIEVFLNMAAEEDLRVNAMFLGRWVDSQ
ncbi:unnamed protein product, partial [Gadus morhua 'NCC']